MILLIAVLVVDAFVAYLLGMGEEHDRPGGTKDLRHRLMLERERTADLQLRLTRAVADSVVARDALVYGPPALPTVLTKRPRDRFTLMYPGHRG